MASLVRWVAPVAIAAGCITPVIPFGGGKSPKQAQHDTMTELGPASLVPAKTWTGDVAPAKIRVWADDDYRAQNLKWQQTFEAQLELANLVLGAVFGVKLVPEYRSWEHRAVGTRLSDDLEALAEVDAGRDVLVVVGLTSSLPLVSATFDELGFAEVGGRHLVVRGYADLEERKVYADAFRDLMPEERELALQSRRQHKTAVILLHELAHTMGADHDSEQDTLMSAHYSHRTSAFSPHAREIVMRGLDQRLRREAAGATAATATATSYARAGSAAAASGPAASGAAARPANAGPLVIHITAEGRAEINGTELDPTAADQLLEMVHKRDPSIELLIKRARGSPTDALDWIVGRATALGMRVSVTMY